MVEVRLPDGNVVEHPDGVTAREVIEAIGPGLARKATNAVCNGTLVDLAVPLEGQVEFKAVLPGDEVGLEVLRHSCAHVMAEAICDLWPETKLVYGPPVENGFYYDIDLDRPLTPDDFKAIEDRMKAIIKEDRPFTRYEMPRDEGLAKLAAEGNEYKVDNAERAEGEVLSFYVTGAAGSGCFEDLCRGPHVPSTGRIGAFKVMQVAGAYHHGDASKKMLQRVYGTAFPDKKELRVYLAQVEEARKRDHRKIGQELGLFTLDPLVGTGLILWKPRGAVLRHNLESFMREQLLARGYQPVYTPHIGRLDLYRTSGHFPYYKDDQFPAMFESERARQLNALWEIAQAAGSETATPAERELYQQLAGEYEDLKDPPYPFDAPLDERLKRVRTWLNVEDGYLLKPMNCPHHVRVYASDRRSYRELPIRLAEFGTVYRHEKSGQVHGMTRVRGFTQDDAHLFCRPEQLQAELADCIELTQYVLKTLNLTDFRVRIGLRDDDDKYVGSRENWAIAEQAIRDAVTAADLDCVEERGEAAFYGPKIDFVVKDCIGRNWQLGTVQVDYNLPQRFGLTYIGEDNSEHVPVMIHRAPFGSLERFCGILIEHFAGAFPLWLAPVQAIVCTVSEKSDSYGREVFDACMKAGLRIEYDQTSERIGAKIRAASMMKIPYVLVIGEQEVDSQTVNVRTRDGKQLGSCTLPEFLAACAKEIVERSA